MLVRSLLSAIRSGLTKEGTKRLRLFYKLQVEFFLLRLATFSTEIYMQMNLKGNAFLETE